MTGFLNGIFLLFIAFFILSEAIEVIYDFECLIYYYLINYLSFKILRFFLEFFKLN
jgi:Co/Zn/Cd efflux system component